ncbi:MAG: Cof-type HAD-IIB family hydrolase [Bacteroidales bacterium]|nr:Cof-type HAD-IIB family hydrolase [Bacteroidales bacterium]
MIKAAFFDIDGTLLSFNTHKVSSGTIESFKALKENGILTFICSGRAKVLVPKMPIHFDGMITVNGGYCQVGGEVIYKNPLNHDDAQRWMDYADRNNYVSMAFTEHEMFTNHIDELARQLRDQLEFEMPKLRPNCELVGEDVYQFIAMIPESKDAEVLAMLPHSRLPRWHPAFSDLIPSDSSKAIGMEKVLSHFGLKRDECIAFGDGANDIEMLEYAGIGVAMGNASDIVKQHANHITSDVDHEGILNALQTMDII